MAEIKRKGNSVQGESLEDLRKAVAEIKDSKSNRNSTDLENNRAVDSQEKFIPKETIKEAEKFQSSTFNIINPNQLSKKDLELRDKFKKFFKKRVEYGNIEVDGYSFTVKTLDAIHVLEGDVDNYASESMSQADKLKLMYRRTFGYFIRSLVSMKSLDTGEEILVEELVSENFGSYEFYKKLESFIIESVPPKIIVDVIIKYADFFESSSKNSGDDENSKEYMSEKKS
jgi:hypothetical protein